MIDTLPFRRKIATLDEASSELEELFASFQSWERATRHLELTPTMVLVSDSGGDALDYCYSGEQRALVKVLARTIVQILAVDEAGEPA